MEIEDNESELGPELQAAINVFAILPFAGWWYLPVQVISLVYGYAAVPEAAREPNTRNIFISHAPVLVSHNHAATSILSKTGLILSATVVEISSYELLVTEEHCL